MIKKTEYVELGLACADVCETIDQGTNRKHMYQLSRSVLEAIEQLAV